MRPMSGGRDAWSSTRFFFGGCEIVMGGLGGGTDGGLSVESGVGFDSVVMAGEDRECIYESVEPVGGTVQVPEALQSCSDLLQIAYARPRAWRLLPIHCAPMRAGLCIQCALQTILDTL